MADRSKKLWQAGYFLSKYSDSDPPAEINTKKWKEAYYFFYNSLGKGKTAVKFEHSLKNCRDAFDSYLNTYRTGWRDKNNKPAALPPLAKTVFDECSQLTRTNIWTELIHSGIKQNEKIEEQSKNTKTKNPDWKREELILALDLYFRLDYGQMHGRNPDIMYLSEELRKLNLHKEIPQPEKFRSVNSVALKLANYKKLDQNFSGRGMRDGAKLDYEIWKEFHSHRDKLKKEADLIKQLYLSENKEKTTTVSEPKLNYKSEFLFQYHKNRETDPLVIKIKKEMVLNNSKALKCEVCNFNSLAFYGELGNDLMEIHYNKELKDMPELQTSEMDDFIVVCSNCHKVLDKNFGLLQGEDIKRIIRKR